MEIRILNENPLMDYRELCLLTLGKHTEENWKPKDELNFWLKNIIANHSCIRSIHFRIIDEQPKNVVMQILRATKGHPQPEVQSSRPDWTGKERSNDPYEQKLFSMDFTPESFLFMCEQRLCNRTEENTRQCVKSWVNQMKESLNPLIKAIGILSMPICEKYGNRCPELKSCGRCKSFISTLQTKEN